MSTTKKIVLIVSAVLLFCLISVGVLIGINYGKGRISNLTGVIGTESISIDENEDLNLDGVTEINVECVSGQINIAPGQPHAELKGNIIASHPKDKYLSVSQKGGVLTVKYDAMTVFPATISGNVTLTVTLPEDVNVHLSVSGASADSSVSGLSLKNLSVQSASGTTKVTDCQGNDMHVTVTSGRIQTDNTAFDRMDIGCTSGDVVVENTSGSVQVTSTSGTVRVANAAGSVDVNSTSGRATVIQEHKEIQDISVSVVSGDIELKLHPEAAFNLSAKSTSGPLHSDYDITISGSKTNRVVGEDLSGKVNGGGPSVTLNATSGSMRLLKNAE